MSSSDADTGPPIADQGPRFKGPVWPLGSPERVVTTCLMRSPSPRLLGAPVATQIATQPLTIEGERRGRQPWRVAGDARKIGLNVTAGE